MSTLNFKTETLSEERIINWEIKNFSQLQERKSPKNESTFIRFTAGQSLKQSSIWELGLTFTKTKEIGLYLHLDKSYETGKSVHAQYWLSIKGVNVPPDVKMRLSNISAGMGFPKFGTLLDILKVKTDGSLINDTLNLQVKIVIYGDEEIISDTTPTCTQKMLKDNSLVHVSNHLGRLLKTGEGSDFVIRVKGLASKEFIERKVHRFVLSAQSPVFEAMMLSQMLEKETGVVTIDDLTPLGLDVLLKFIYTGNLSNAWKFIPEEIINAAEKYQFPLLKTYCDEWLHTACTPDNATNLRDLARKHRLGKASKDISEYIKSNLDNVLDAM